MEAFGFIAALRAQPYTYDTLLFHAIHISYRSLRHHISRCCSGSVNVDQMMMRRLEAAEDLLSSRVVDSGVVGLHMGALDFAILDHQGVTLATVLTEDGSTVKGEIKLLGELTGRITEKADFALGSWVEVFSPCFHDKRIIDRDNKDFAGTLELVAIDVARDMSGRAGRAEGGRHADDEAFAGGKLLGQVDLVAGGTFDEVDVWEGSTDFDHVDGCLMEGSNGFVC